MIPVIVEAGKNSNTAMEDNEKFTRYKNNVDTYSLMEGDGQTDDMERKILGEVIFVDIIKELTNDRERFIAIALYIGYSKVEIAGMLRLNPSSVTRTTQRMQTILKSYYKPRRTRI
jgi:hypothetical protein